jgi:NEDD8-activating enzyme E1 regulatory subunit
VIGPTSIESVLRQVTERAQKHSIPVIFIEAVGFYSRFTIQLPDVFPIVETHPDPETTQDLRLVKPWPEFVEYMRSKTHKLESLSEDDHGHVPWLLLLLHYLDRWKASHGAYPTTYKDKTAFRAEVAAAARKDNSEGGEENYDEAVAAVLKSLNPLSIPSGLKEIFAEQECQHPTTASANFWIIAHSLDIFVQKHGVLPLPGSIPDMKAQSADYIALQKIYRAKAQSDLAAVTITVRKLEEDLNRVPLESREIEQFCKGAAFVKLVRGRRVAVPAAQDQQKEIHVDWASREAMIARELGDPDSLMAIYVAMSALDCTLDASSVTADPAAALALFKDGVVPTPARAAAQAMLNSLKVKDPEFDKEAATETVEKALQELARSGPVELHNTASLTGGMVAQEAIKVITKQYVPADNTIVWDGISSRAGAFRL